MTYTILTPATAEPVAIEELRLSARVEAGDGLDAELLSLAKVAREQAEQAAGIYVMPQTVRLSLREFEDVLSIRRGPVRSVTSVTYWNGTSWSAIDQSAYVVYEEAPTWFIEPVSAWPSLVDRPGHRVRIDFSAGWPDAASVPESVKRFIQAQTAEWLNSPSGEQPLSLSLLRLLDPIKTYA